MNTNTLKISLLTLLAHTMCFTVVLSHMHAKDAVSLFSPHSSMNRIASTSDITAKALGDLHHHVDKTGLKNISTDSSATAARTRELNPLNAEMGEAEGLLGLLHNFLLRFRIVGSLIYNYA